MSLNLKQLFLAFFALVGKSVDEMFSGILSEDGIGFS